MTMTKFLGIGGSLHRASLWTVVGYVGGQLLRLINSLLLTRLIQPEAFGLMAIVMVVIIGVEMTTDLGLNASIVQNRNGDQDDFLRTAWTIKIVRGLLMATLIAGLSAPLAHLYREPELQPMLMAVALITIISNLSSNSLAVASRRLWLGRPTAIALVGQAAAVLTANVWAFIWPTVWCLVAGQAVNALVTMILSHLAILGFRDRVGWNAERAREIVSFGKWMFLSSLLVFFSSQIDRIVLPKIVPMAEFGFYSIALMWAQLPVIAVQTWCQRIIFPLASSMLREGTSSTNVLFKHRRRIVALSALAFLVLYLIFDDFFRLLYTEEYWPVIGFFKLLLVGSVIRIIDETYRVLNLAAGKPQYTSIGNLVAIIVFVLALLLFGRNSGVVGVVVSYNFAQMGALLVSVIGSHRYKLNDLRFDGTVVVAASLIALGLEYLIRVLSSVLALVNHPGFAGGIFV